jgi:hypothetical protein
LCSRRFQSTICAEYSYVRDEAIDASHCTRYESLPALVWLKRDDVSGIIYLQHNVLHGLEFFMSHWGRSQLGEDFGNFM